MKNLPEENPEDVGHTKGKTDEEREALGIPPLVDLHILEDVRKTTSDDDKASATILIQLVTS